MPRCRDFGQVVQACLKHTPEITLLDFQSIAIVGKICGVSAKSRHKLRVFGKEYETDVVNNPHIFLK